MSFWVNGAPMAYIIIFFFSLCLQLHIFLEKEGFETTGLQERYTLDRHPP